MQFKTEKISEHITRIHGFCTEFMYLIEGSKAAVLIDTGCGFYSLKDCIHNLTNKPLKVLITHGHVDHAMGANEFEEIYLNHKDKSVYQLHSEKGFRLEGAKGLCPEKGLIKETDMIPSAPFEKFHNLQEGDVFELGGIHVVIYEFFSVMPAIHFYSCLTNFPRDLLPMKKIYERYRKKLPENMTES